MALMGRVITAVAGRAVARTIGGVAAGPAGLALGATLPMLGMVGVAIGAWAVNHIIAKRAASSPGQSAPAKPVDQITSARSAVTS